MDTNLQLDEKLWELAKQLDERAKPVERYQGYAFLQAFREAIAGLNPQLSTSELKRLRRNLEARLGRYARWIRVDLYPHEKGVAYQTNFNEVFKTRHGTIYGHPDGFLRPLFYTSHSLERFSQRTKARQYTKITSRYLKQYGRRPTPAEVLDEILVARAPWLEFGLIPKKEVYINTLLGILVVESFQNIYVAKTFILHNYGEEMASWYRVTATDTELSGEENIDRCNLKGLLHHYAEPCRPVFLQSL